MRRRSTVLVAAAVALAGLAVGVIVDQVDDGDTADASAADPCLSNPPLVAVAGNDPDSQGLARVRVIRADGSTAVVTPDDWVATDPALAPDETRLVVTRANRDHESAGPTAEHLWTMGIDGAAPEPLTDGDVYDRAAAWSPDGGTIAFVRVEGSETQIMVVPAEGGSATALVPAEPFVGVDDPAWSPDGSRLAFVRRRFAADSGPPELWTVAADGSGATPVGPVDPDAATVDWHPDGSRILVSSFREQGEGSLALVDLAAGASTTVARDATFGRWSRRGTQIVYFTRTGVTRESVWRLVETPFAVAALGDARDLGLTDRLYPYFSLAVGGCEGWPRTPGATHGNQERLLLGCRRSRPQVSGWDRSRFRDLSQPRTLDTTRPRPLTTKNLDLVASSRAGWAEHPTATSAPGSETNGALLHLR